MASPTPKRAGVPTPPRAKLLSLATLTMNVEQYQAMITTVVKDTLKNAATNFNARADDVNRAQLQRAMWARQGLDEIMRSDDRGQILTALAERAGIGRWANLIAEAHQEGDVGTLVAIK